VKKLLNTLYITTQGAYLAKDGESLVVKIEGETKIRTPAHTLGGVVCFGQVSVSPFAMGHLVENNAPVSFLTANGRFLARVTGPVSGNVLLRREQYRRADNPDQSAKIASFALAGKLANCRTVLRRAARDHGGEIDAQALDRAAGKITAALEAFSSGGSLDTLRGLEGDAAHVYFSVFDHLIVAQKQAFKFNGRNRRPPLDNVNCLLSFLYTLLTHDVCSAIETVGLDPGVGFLHRDRPGRPGLALDMVEELRPVIADRLALRLINLKQVKPGGFKKQASGAVLMDDETRKTVLVEYQKRKQDQIMHPFLREKIPLGLLFHVQARLMSRYLRNDLDGYPPFIWK